MWMPDENTSVTYIAQDRTLRDIFADAKVKGKGFIQFYDGLGLGNHLAVAQDRAEAIKNFNMMVELSRAYGFQYPGESFFALNEESGSWEHLQPFEMKQRLGI